MSGPKREFKSGDRIEQMYGDYSFNPPLHLWKVGVFLRYDEDCRSAWVLIDDNRSSRWLDDHGSMVSLQFLRRASALDQLAWALRDDSTPATASER